MDKHGTYYILRLKLNTNVYVINAAWEWIPMEQVHELYTLRWQIEIVFKTWKLLYKNKHVVLVLDNTRYHHAKILKSRKKDARRHPFDEKRKLK